MADLASHNTMSYLPPRRWWLYPFRFMARCQSKSIREQYEKYGIKCFDLRITFDRNGRAYFAHGNIVYKGNVHDTLAYLNSLNAGIKVRLILEVNSYSGDIETKSEFFRRYCSWFENQYRNIAFFEGVRKFDWKPLYDFGYKPTYDQKISSMTRPHLLDDWWPWLYAKRKNRENIQAGSKNRFLFIDFVNIQ